jgi:hypothetical protein
MGIEFLKNAISELQSNKEEYTNDWTQQKQMFLDYFETEK